MMEMENGGRELAMRGAAVGVELVVVLGKDHL